MVRIVRICGLVYKLWSAVSHTVSLEKYDFYFCLSVLGLVEEDIAFGIIHKCSNFILQPIWDKSKPINGFIYELQSFMYL